MKKIAFVTRVLTSGGAEMVLGQIINACTQRGIECLVLTVWHNDTIPSFLSDVKVLELEQTDDSLKGKVQQYKQVRTLIKEYAPDVVLSMPEDIGIYVIAAMLGTGIPVVVSERNNPWVMPYKKISRILRRFMYPFAKGLIFQTERAASFFSTRQQKKGIVLPNPLDISRLPEVYTGDREKIIVSAGRLDNQKNFPLLIRAFAQFHEKHPDYRLIIYGEGSKREELEALATQLLPDCCWSMPGRVNDLPNKISRCAIFALSSDYEGVPNVLIEAMAVGTPAVSTDCAPGGAATLINSGENGILTPVGDVSALAEALCQMAENPVEATAMAEKATDVRNKLDAEIVVARWIEYLNKVCEGNIKNDTYI